MSSNSVQQLLVSSSCFPEGCGGRNPTSSMFPKAADAGAKKGLNINENIAFSQCALNYNFKSQSFSFLTDMWHFGEIFKYSKSVRKEFGGLAGTVFRTERKGGSFLVKGLN